MPSVDGGVQRELKMWKPNFQQTILDCSMAAHAHNGLRAQACFQECLCWTWSHDLGPQPELWSPENFWAFFFFHNLNLDLERNPAIGPPTGWSNTWGWDMKFFGPSGPSVSAGGLRSSLNGGCGWRWCKVAFHNVTPRRRNSHKSNFPIFGKGL